VDSTPTGQAVLQEVEEIAFDLAAAKRELFLTGEKQLGSSAERALEALARFGRGELTVPRGLTEAHLSNYREAAMNVIERAQGISAEAGARAQAVQQPRIDLIDAILASGGP
jgi:hypothetical protein